MCTCTPDCFCQFPIQPDLLLLVFLWVLGNGLWWSDTHLCGLERLQSAPHGPLEDLLHLIFIFVDVEMAPAVPVSVLVSRKESITFSRRLRVGESLSLNELQPHLLPALVQMLLQQMVSVDVFRLPHALYRLLVHLQAHRRHRVPSTGEKTVCSGGEHAACGHQGAVSECRSFGCVISAGVRSPP